MANNKLLIMRKYRLMLGDTNNLRMQKIRAAYFQNEGAYVVFKDADNQAVHSVRQDYLVTIERLDEAQCDQTDHRGAFTCDEARHRLLGMPSLETQG